jgi:predicted DCC family thiol-disulfide oxidoreductase YuxK
MWGVSRLSKTRGQPEFQNSPMSLGRHRLQLYYDGDCGLCRAIIVGLKALDWSGRCSWIAYQSLREPPVGLSWENLRTAVVLETSPGEYLQGFYAFRKLCGVLPLLFPLVPLLHMPLITRVGIWVYRWIATHRHCANIK